MVRPATGTERKLFGEAHRLFGEAHRAGDPAHRLVRRVLPWALQASGPVAAQRPARRRGRGLERA